MDEIESLLKHKALDFFDLEKELEIARRKKVGLDTGCFQFVKNVLFLMEKIEAMKFKPTLVMDHRGFRDQFFRAATTKAFDQMENFDSVGVRHKTPANWGIKSEVLSKWMEMLTNSGFIDLICH